MLFFALSIFLSAFLLFQIQPMIGKFILPWFGGTPAVWSTAMLFFQVLLTGGYAYAYWLVKRPQQRWIHIALLGMTLALLTVLGLGWPSPITPAADIRPAVANFPVFDIFLILTVSVGLPYFLLAANGPLMQAWFSRIFPHQSYTQLYALSNFGSLLGLLVYPILIEPSLTLLQQGWAWTCGFILFVLIAGVLSYRARGESGVIAHVLTIEKPSQSLRALWIILSGTASLFLLSVTNQVSQEVAVIPFLWIVPLAIYLLSFIFAFSDSRWYDRRLYALLFSLASLAMLWVLTNAESLNVIIQIAIYSLLLFLASMICHGELYRLRPHADHLTSFYLMVSLGGAAGGIFVNLIAPFIFTGYWEFYLAWLITIVLLVVMLFPYFSMRVNLQARAMSLSFFISVVLLSYGLNYYENAFYVERNFYGVIRVREWDKKANSMIHGMTVHGVQYLDDRIRPTTYYVEDSGVGLVLLNHPKRGHAPSDIALAESVREVTQKQDLKISAIKPPDPPRISAIKPPPPPKISAVKNQPLTDCININIEFGPGSVAIGDNYNDEIQSIVKYFIRNPEAKLTIIGHTDNIGTKQNNLALSKRRATSVKNYLMDKFNIDGQRLIAQGVGSTLPVADNDTDEGRKKNGRVTINNCP